MSLTIGITTHYSEPSKEESYFFLRRNYCNIIEDLGHTPILLPILNSSNAIKDILEKIDIFLFSGGGPDISDKKRVKSLREQNPKRYDFERKLIQECIKRSIPMIGICRGFQTIAEVLGGEINLKIKSKIVHNNENHNQEGAHSICIEKGSMLFKSFKKTKIRVNSLHTQSVKKLPKTLIVTARSADNIIETYESNKPPILGTQFHPEKMIKHKKEFQKLFKSFLNKAEQHKKQ